MWIHECWIDASPSNWTWRRAFTKISAQRHWAKYRTWICPNMWTRTRAFSARNLTWARRPSIASTRTSRGMLWSLRPPPNTIGMCCRTATMSRASERIANSRVRSMSTHDSVCRRAPSTTATWSRRPPSGCRRPYLRNAIRTSQNSLMISRRGTRAKWASVWTRKIFVNSKFWNNFTWNTICLSKRNKETRFLGPDHVFGLTNMSEQFGAADVVHGRTPNKTLKGKERERAFIASLRSYLAGYNYTRFKNLVEAFKFYDKVINMFNLSKSLESS